MTLWLAVAGRPALQSRSPELFTPRGDVAYLRLAADSPGHALALARELGLDGINVTAPFKHLLPLLDDADADARLVGAANTVVFDPAGAQGFNTDVAGVSRTLRSAGVAVDGAEALVLGAGGAARAAVVALLRDGAGVTVVNRTDARAAALVAELRAGFSAGDRESPRGEGCPRTANGVLGQNRLTAVSWADREAAARRAAVIVDCRSTGEACLDPGVWTPAQVLLPARYATSGDHVADARAAGAQVLDPLDWLRHQADAAWEHFARRTSDAGSRARVLPTGWRWPNSSQNGANSGKFTEFAAADSRAPRHIALIGGMGAGKTTVGRLLADRLGLPFVDLDEEIVAAAGRSIPEFFERDGERAFRARESTALADALSGPTSVIACGGGTPVAAANRHALATGATTVWLWCPPELAAARLTGATDRPLLAGSDPLAALTALAAQRRDAYAAASDLVVDAGAHTPSELADRIADELDHAGRTPR